MVSKGEVIMTLREDNIEKYNPKHKKCKHCGEILLNPKRTYCCDKCSREAKKIRDKTKNSIKIGGKGKATSYKGMKKKAWAEFSKYIRLRSADSNGMVKCVTCPDDEPKKHWKEMQAGHFVGGRGNAVLFDEEIVYPQCLTGDSELILIGGKKIKISNIKVNDKIMAFDDKTFVYKEAIVEDIKSFIPNNLYKVTMENNDIFYATPDHKVVANNKWVDIEFMYTHHATYDILEIWK